MGLEPRLRRIEADMAPQSRVKLAPNNKKPSAHTGLRTHTNARQELRLPVFEMKGGLAYGVPILVIEAPGSMASCEQQEAGTRGVSCVQGPLFSVS
ncbi:MAG TPA: hypothetical protein DCL72_15735, partial [Rhizobiales bacterium]|nr:hypothetical protein [Hyphomicrobiales bacterium]